MTRVSIVIPALADTALLTRNLPPLLAELERRQAEDEIVVVDDSGDGLLAPWMEDRHPTVRVLTQAENGGFGSALLAGAREARCELMFAMNPDVSVRPGFLDPLVDALLDPSVFAVSPRVLLDGDESRPESHNLLRFEDGRLQIVPREWSVDPQEARPVPFCVGGAFLVDRAEFLAGEGFDPLFEPFYWEDVDLCLAAWRRGRRVLEIPLSVVEHHHRGTIGACVPEELVTAAIEKNRLLLFWKYLDTQRDAHDHLASLWRDALDAAMAGRREELVWLALALQELPRVNRSRESLPKAERSLDQVLRESDPIG